MTSGGAEGAENLCCGIDFSVGKEYGGGGVRHGRRWKDSRHSGERRTVKKSTGIGGKSHEPVSHTLGEFMEAMATAAGMTADLPMIEDQGQGVSQQPNHGQHHESRTLVDRRVFKMAVGGQGLKYFGIDPPPAAAQLIDE